MNLSYWERTSFFEDSDYCVIGAGIVGLFAALHLKEQNPEAKVLVLERSMIPDGASTKNAGFACFGSLSELIEQKKKSSEEELCNLVAKRWAGLNKLRRVLGDEAIEFNNWGGYELFTAKDADVWQDCLKQLPYFNSILKNSIDGAEDIYQIADHKIETFGFQSVEHLIYNPYEAQIHSGKMMEALIKKCREKNVQIFFGAEVKKINQEEKIASIELNNFELKTKNVIVCTNAFATELLPALELEPGRGQVFVTNKIKNLKLKGTFHYDAGYFYFRNIDGRVLIGGGRNLNFEKEKTTAFGITQEVKNEITRLMNEVIIPNTDWHFEMEWSGIMAFGKELVPIVKQVSPNIFCAVRCNGMGVAIGSILAEEVANLALKNS
jgi:gamma-glutamylputrescine oxidase